MQNRKIDHINLTVPNLAQAVAFYTETMGFTVTGRFMGHREFVFISDGAVTYELLENTALEQTVIDHIAYKSDDIKADFAHFSAMGITTTDLGFIDFLFEKGMHFFFIKGAGGDRIEFCQKAV